MQVSCLQQNLSRALAIVGRAVATRSNLPVLQNVKIGTEDGMLVLTATNLDIAITTKIGAQVERQHAVSGSTGSAPIQRTCELFSVAVVHRR